jgi:hypothetical protein
LMGEKCNYPKKKHKLVMQNTPLTFYPTTHLL